MKIEIQLTRTPIVAPKTSGEFSRSAGAVAEFSGIVRDSENGEPIAALEYEAYSPMAEKEIRRILEALGGKHPCLAATVIHRLGVIPVGEAAIYISVLGKHRGEAFAVLTEFMNRLKQDVPIWKTRALKVAAAPVVSGAADPHEPGRKLAMRSLDEALAEISSHCQPLAGVRTALAQAHGRVLRENAVAADAFPPCDKSTRDGYAMLRGDDSKTFVVVDTLNAADWKPRRLKTGEAVRVATGASLPCEQLRVVMQEDVARTGDTIQILEDDDALNVRQRGEEMAAGETLLTAGTRLNAGALALLAALGHAHPLVSPCLQVLHFTTGDEIVSPDQTPKPGQIRDSNSILIRALLATSGGDVVQRHLPENFDAAKRMIAANHLEPSRFHLILVSGGASVGDQDFTRPLLEWLGFEIIFNRVNIRPGAPLIFGQHGARLAFGLPGNPVSHFACFHLFVATTLARLTGARSPQFLSGTLASALDEAPNPRETLWPARCESQEGAIRLTPLPWSSSGDVKCLAQTNALIRVPPKSGPLHAGTPVAFLKTDEHH